MKKFYLFFLAAALSMSMFAAGETGKTKSDAIPYNWAENRIAASSEAGVGKWYKVDLDKSHGGPFYDKAYILEKNLSMSKLGKTDDGNTEIDVKIENPLSEEVNLTITAIVGDNSESRSMHLDPRQTKPLRNLGSGMLVAMGTTRVYLYVVMDVTVTEQQAEDLNAVRINITETAPNKVNFDFVDFDWTNGNDIAANKETWLRVIWSQEDILAAGKTIKMIVENKAGVATTLKGGLAFDRPASSIQESTKELGANGSTKVIDPTTLSMMPETLYVRINAGQPIHVSAEIVEPVLPANPIFNINGATSVVRDEDYNLNGEKVYSVAYNTLVAEEYYNVVAEITNNSDQDVEIEGFGAESSNADNDGNVWFAASRKLTVRAGGVPVKKEIDKSMLKNYSASNTFYAKVVSNGAVSFRLYKVCTIENPCIPENLEATVVVPAEGSVQRQHAEGATKWYPVNIEAAQNAQADIVLTLNAEEEANMEVDIAQECALGAPAQSYSGKSKNTTRTIGYSLFKDAGNILYIRVKSDKDITVSAELLSVVRYTATGWTPNYPTANDMARIEANLTIANEEIEALGITLAGGKITIQNSGSLRIGAEGVKGSETIDQIVIEEGGKLLIDPACSKNNQPFITAQKKLHFGELASGDQNELHDFIALPIENREQGLGVSVRYVNWDRTAGWVATDGFRNTFVGYNVFKMEGDAGWVSGAEGFDVTALFRGQLSSNKNQTLKLSANGWFAFGNSWLAPIAVGNLYNALNASAADPAIHIYVHTPNEYGYGLQDNYYIPATAAIAGELGITEIAPMQGFFLHTSSAASVALKNPFATSANNAPARATADELTMVGVRLSDNNIGDFVNLIEGNDVNATKMVSKNLAIYAEDKLGQVAKENLIGTILTIKTSDAEDYTLSTMWAKGETIYLKDLDNGNVIAMTADRVYSFKAEPNTVSARFQVIGRQEVPTGMESNAVINGANKRIENGKMVIIKNGVKYNVLGAQL